MNVAILTANRLLGDSLAACLHDRGVAASVAVAASFSAVRTLFAEMSIDLVLVDVTRGIDHGEVRALVASTADVPVLALGLDSERKDVVSCGRAGFAGYVSRSASFEGLCAAMADAIAGRLRCPPEVAAELLRALYREAPSSWSPAHRLTPRECEVLGRLGEGLSNKEIAGDLGLTVPTVKHHVHNILEKLAVTRRAEAMRKVRDTPWIVRPAGWAPPSPAKASNRSVG